MYDIYYLIIYLHFVDFCGKLVGEHTIPMDPMGLKKPESLVKFRRHWGVTDL